ncbi:hypothetical protein [Phormidesmis priestleyi]
MTAAERIYELVKTMPDEQVHEVLAFVEALGMNPDLHTQPQSASTDISLSATPQIPQGSQVIPKGTLTGLRGIAKQRVVALTDEEVREEYTDYLVKKYQ